MNTDPLHLDVKGCRLCTWFVTSAGVSRYGTHRIQGDNNNGDVTYTDGIRCNWIKAAHQRVCDTTPIGLEFDHVNAQLLNLLNPECSGVTVIDNFTPSIQLLMITFALKFAHIPYSSNSFVVVSMLSEGIAPCAALSQ